MSGICENVGSGRGMVDAIQGRCRDAGVGPRHDPPCRGGLRASRIVPVGPTRAVDAGSGGVACGIPANKLNVLDQDWEAAFGLIAGS